MTTTPPQRKDMDVEAADLRPGDWILDEHGEVDHGVYDVHVHLGTQPVRIWTRTIDQRLGWPYRYDVPPATRFRISRITR